MDTTRVLLFLFVVSSWWCCNARDIAMNRVIGKSEIVTVVQPRDNLLEGEVRLVNAVSKDKRLCALCEDFAGQALDYLSENKTQTEIIDTLHKSCAKISSFKQQCIVLVDYYATLFFLEASSIEAGEFCRKVDLCEKEEVVLSVSPPDKCDICQNIVTEALLKLKDPDTELEIIQLLLKACDSAGKSAKKCKRLVFEYAPIILVNAEQFLETNNVCAILHACDSTEEVEMSSSSIHAAS